MKTCNFTSLRSEDFYIDEISSIYQTPAYRFLDNPGRQCNGFIIIEEGECEFTWNMSHCKLKKGSVIYLPYGSVHKMNSTSEELAFTRINFTTHYKDSEIFTFSESPYIMCSYFDSSIMAICHELNKLFLDATAIFMLKSKLYELFDKLDHIITSKENNPIDIAVKYIEKHYTENFDCKKLVDLSYLSQASLYRAFKKHVSMTPIEYKNYLRIKQAKLMLQTEEYSINEIAAFLGFDSLYYFSRIFKSVTGKSPSMYRKNFNANIAE